MTWQSHTTGSGGVYRAGILSPTVWLQNLCQPARTKPIPRLGTRWGLRTGRLQCVQRWNGIWSSSSRDFSKRREASRASSMLGARPGNPAALGSWLLLPAPAAGGRCRPRPALVRCWWSPRPGAQPARCPCAAASSRRGPGPASPGCCAAAPCCPPPRAT